MRVSMTGTLVLGLFGVTDAVGQVTFDDVTSSVGITYAHPQPPRFAGRQALLLQSQQTPLSVPELAQGPMFNAAGKNAILLLDYDHDGDIDIFATNIKGQAHSLFQNQLTQTGLLSFIDVAHAAGIDAPDHDASGACHGDIDNDGDSDIFVVGDDEPHRLYKNNGDGTFTDISGRSGPVFGEGPLAGGMGCSFGDIDNDGLLDLHLTRAWDFETGVPCALEAFDGNLPNAMFENLGYGRFKDVTATSGILTIEGGDIPAGAQSITWAQALVDYDQDGDVDLFNLDDQCAFPPALFGGLDRGLIQVWDNDGHGNFTNRTLTSGTDVMGQWMGIDFADFNHDGHLDFMATNMGDYLLTIVGQPPLLGFNASRWFFGGSQGTFQTPPLNNVGGSVFGWGTVVEDFDNDGDTDIFYAGGIDLTVVVSADNPDVLLLNDGAGNFDYLPGSTSGRGILDNVQAVAAADLDRDGRMDIVTGSNFTWNPNTPLVPLPASFGFPDLEQTTFFVPNMAPVPGDRFVWTGLSYDPGQIRVELNQSTTPYKSVTVRPVGAVGLTKRATVNRSGIGAVVSFTPRGGKTAIKPVTGGASHLAQGDGTVHFGMEAARRGTLDVLWPGGVRNRRYNVRAHRTVLMPEIPCSIDTPRGRRWYRRCVRKALQDLKYAGVISYGESVKLFVSAMRAYREERH